MSGPGHREGYVKEIWLLLCREGGTWAPEEVNAVITRTNRTVIAKTMHTMVSRSGQLKHYKVKGRAHFGVTHDCKIPEGITVRDLAEAGVIAQ